MPNGVSNAGLGVAVEVRRAWCRWIVVQNRPSMLRAWARSHFAYKNAPSAPHRTNGTARQVQEFNSPAMPRYPPGFPTEASSL